MANEQNLLTELSWKKGVADSLLTANQPIQTDSGCTKSLLCVSFINYVWSTPEKRFYKYWKIIIKAVKHFHERKDGQFKWLNEIIYRWFKIPNCEEIYIAYRETVLPTSHQTIVNIRAPCLHKQADNGLVVQ